MKVREDYHLGEDNGTDSWEYAIKEEYQELEQQIKKLKDENYALLGQNQQLQCDNRKQAKEIKELKIENQIMVDDLKTQHNEINELKDEKLDYTKWLIEELDNRMIDKVTDEDAESFIKDYDELNKH